MDGLEKLQELGCKKIASATHIPVNYVENILNKEFAAFQKPQFFGFISILEREYKIDLSGLKQEFLFSRAEEEMTKEPSIDLAETNPKLFDKKKLLENKKLIYGVSSVAGALLLILLLSMIDFSSPKEQKIEINNTAIDQAKKNLNMDAVAVANVDEMVKENEVESAEFG